MAEFLDTFDVERTQLLRSVSHFEDVWQRFQQQRTLDVETDEEHDSLIAGELTQVRDELKATKFTIGIFGLIKRGKSTLLNSLIGREVSSMHVTPETAVPVYVDHGDQPGAEVHMADGTIKHVAVEDVTRYTSQKHNPNNQDGVTYVHQKVPVSFLKHGTRLIDTPGLDDAEADEVYTQRTMQELDAADAGIVCFLSPPTVGSTEMKFLEQVTKKRLNKTFLVCNMYPQHFHNPQTRRDVLTYIGKRIAEASKTAGATGQLRIYPVCALEAWQARRDGDMTAFKKSGAARLLRDIELYLSNDAGGDVLTQAAERVQHAAELARNEVRIRQQLLDDPDQLEQHRADVDTNIKQLERTFDQAVTTTLAQVEPLKNKVRAQLHQPFARARGRLEACSDVEEIQTFISRFQREVQVAGEIAQRNFHFGFEKIAEELKDRLENEFQSVINDLASGITQVTVSTRSLMLATEQIKAEYADAGGDLQTTLGTAAAGGLAVGGASWMLLGGLLGPVGLAAGALIGWRLSSLAGGRSINKAKEEIISQLNHVAAQLNSDLDSQIEGSVKGLREAAKRRRRMFASDLYAQFDLVQALAADPAAAERVKAETSRFDKAFASCATNAQQLAEQAQARKAA